MTKIFKRLWTYQVSIAIALILMLTELAVELVQPLIMAKIIDDGLAQEHTETVILWGSILVGISLLAFAAGIINTFYSAHVSQNFGYSLRKELYSIIQYFTFANSSKFASSSLITRLTNDITQLQNMIFMGLRFLLRSPLLIIGGIIMSFVVNARLALLLAVTIPVIILMFIWVIRKGGRMFKKVQGKLDFLNNVMLENLTAVKLIKAYVRKRFETDRFIFASNDLRRNTEKALRLMEITVPLLLFIMNLCIIAILWLGSGQIAAGQTQVGDVVAIINYSLRITSSLSVITMLIMVVSRCKASADRLQEVFEMEEKDSNGHENASKQLEINGKLEFKDVAFVYPNTEYNVLAGISFTVQPNEVIAVMGITGAGKTTLFQLIPRLYEPTKGAVYIDGTDIREYNLDSIRKQIGYVPQVSLLFTGTIKENIRWGNPFATDNEIVKAAKDAQIHDTIMKLPMKYDTRIGQKGINLSGGQRQRLSIARALVRKPKILLLDDSTSALDLQTEKELLQAISTYNTALLITQKISTARKADRILLMEEGKILAYAHHDQLLKEIKLYQKIVESQLGKEEASHV
ncbi:ABC transporter ATP-binding protein [Niallia taxi]|uniref:ABC transporter ATP-binding protein n=1 Tax=Niallia taxi TaxID=2499688 RepID=UPI003F60AAB0